MKINSLLPLSLDTHIFFYRRLDPIHGSRIQLGVDLAISSSSSFISAPIFANNGVLKYRSPVSIRVTKYS